MRGLVRLIFVGRPAVAVACLTNKTGGGRLLVVVVLQPALGKVVGFFVRNRSFAVSLRKIQMRKIGIGSMESDIMDNGFPLKLEQ